MNPRFEKASNEVVGDFNLISLPSSIEIRTSVRQRFDQLSTSYDALQAVAAAAARYRQAENAEQAALALAELHGVMNALPAEALAALKGNP